MATGREFESAVRAWASVFMRRSVHEFMVAMKDSGLSTSQLNTLMRLHYRGSCPVSGISDELGLTAAAASQIVDRLAGMGLIERTEDPTDRRVRQVRLTAKGRGLVARGVEARIAWVRDLATRVPPGELGGIIQALARLTDAANASDDEHLAKLAMVRSNG
ncbi:MAG TPA: MarR family transcriptional regulator [Anaerolineales bacterium]|nr:MarR family transcriptional regulator [Anaerolineales bacterium]